MRMVKRCCKVKDHKSGALKNVGATHEQQMNKEIKYTCVRDSQGTSAWKNPSNSRIPDNKLQALVYDILPPTTAIVHYALGLKKTPLMNSFSMMLKWQEVCNRQLVSTVSFKTEQDQNRPKSFALRWNSFFFFSSFLQRADMSHVCVLGRYVALAQSS